MISLKSSERLPVLRGFLRQVKRALGPGLRPLPRLGRSEPPRPRRSLPPASVPPSGVSLVGMPRWMHRVADENEDAPESFALKVPVTVGDVPEEQFLNWFREEPTDAVGAPSARLV